MDPKQKEKVRIPLQLYTSKKRSDGDIAPGHQQQAAVVRDLSR
jgi:hypothetical protein